MAVVPEAETARAAFLCAGEGLPSPSAPCINCLHAAALQVANCLIAYIRMRRTLIPVDDCRTHVRTGKGLVHWCCATAIAPIQCEELSTSCNTERVDGCHAGGNHGAATLSGHGWRSGAPAPPPPPPPPPPGGGGGGGGAPTMHTETHFYRRVMEPRATPDVCTGHFYRRMHRLFSTCVCKATIVMAT